MSKWEKAELTKSDRPELTSAKIVVSGGMFNFKQITTQKIFLGGRNCE